MSAAARRVPAAIARLTATAALAATTIAACGQNRGNEGPVAGDPPAAATTILYGQFSSAPSLGNGEGAPDPSAGDYGALSVFVQKVAAATDSLGPDLAVRFSLLPGVPTLAEVANNTYPATYFAGGSLNGVWGFVYNSVPFGPSFSQMLDFLYEGRGIELANRILAERGVDVVAFPVVGSPAQMSGYFRKPVGPPECREGDAECIGHGPGIGLEGLCAEPWTLRYLPPAESILDLACDRFSGPQRLGFVRAIPGGSEFLTAIQEGTIDGLEFATPLDDFDAAKGGFFANPSAPTGSDGRNAGEIGLRFAHYPAWHQPFYLGWVVVNRSQVWDGLTAEQRAAVEGAAREAVVESFEASSSVQCDYLRRILEINEDREQRGPGGAATGVSADMVLTRWSPADLERLRDATLRFLEDARGGSAPTADQSDYTAVLTALHQHLGYPTVEAMLAAWSEPDFPVQGGCGR